MSMIQFFEAQRADIFAHAVDCYPHEACGVIIDDVYVACQNRAENPEHDFRIDFEKEFDPARYHDVQAIVHSHGDQPFITAADMAAQVAAAMPYGMVSVISGRPDKIVWWGDQLPIQPLLERTFEHGVRDCSSLVRDWFRMQGTVFPNTPRDWQWWKTGRNLLEDELRAFGFQEISRETPLKNGDVLTFIIGRDETGAPLEVINHSAVVVEQQLILHHLYNRLSRREPAHIWARRAKKIFRYPNL
jgi:proteasome lid subunit RPN8/RPN11